MRRLSILVLLGLVAAVQAQWTWRLLPEVQGDSLRLEVRLADPEATGRGLGQFNLRGRFVAGVDTSTLPALTWSHPDFTQSVTSGTLPSVWQLNAVLDAESGPVADTGGVAVAVLMARLAPGASVARLALFDLPQTFQDDRVTRAETVRDTTGWTLDLSQSPVEETSPATGGWTLSAPFPCPFGEIVTLRLLSHETVQMEGAVYDVTGRRVCVWPEQRLPAGVHDLVWDGRDAVGRAVAPGLYVWRVTVQGRPLIRKLIRLPRGGRLP